MSVGYLADAFDLVNVRDLDLIAQARERCSRLVLGVHSDHFEMQTSGRRPVIPLNERMAILRHLRGIADVVVHEELSGIDADLVFTADDLGAATAGAIVLTPRRRSGSSILTGIFVPAGQECVA